PYEQLSIVVLGRGDDHPLASRSLSRWSRCYDEVGGWSIGIHDWDVSWGSPGNIWRDLVLSLEAFLRGWKLSRAGSFFGLFFMPQTHGGRVHPPWNPPKSVLINVTFCDSLEAASIPRPARQALRLHSPHEPPASAPDRRTDPIPGQLLLRQWSRRA